MHSETGAERTRSDDRLRGGGANSNIVITFANTRTYEDNFLRRAPDVFNDLAWRSHLRASTSPHFV